MLNWINILRNVFWLITFSASPCIKIRYPVCQTLMLAHKLRDLRKQALLGGLPPQTLPWAVPMPPAQTQLGHLGLLTQFQHSHFDIRTITMVKFIHTTYSHPLEPASHPLPRPLQFCDQVWHPFRHLDSALANSG